MSAAGGQWRRCERRGRCDLCGFLGLGVFWLYWTRTAEWTHSVCAGCAEQGGEE